MFKSILVATALLWTVCAYSQKFTITGSVQDVEQNEALAGATVELENSSQFAVTNEDGFFKIEGVPAGNYTVVVRFLGYASNCD